MKKKIFNPETEKSGPHKIKLSKLQTGDLKTHYLFSF